MGRRVVTMTGSVTLAMFAPVVAVAIHLGQDTWLHIGYQQYIAMRYSGVDLAVWVG